MRKKVLLVDDSNTVLPRVLTGGNCDVLGAAIPTSAL